MYDDYDVEEMGEAEFEICKMKFKNQVVAKLANAQSARFCKDANDCNCASGHSFHPWSKDTSGFNPKGGGGTNAADFRYKDRPSGRRPQVLLHLMLISMQLSALRT